MRDPVFILLCLTGRHLQWQADILPNCDLRSLKKFIMFSSAADELLLHYQDELLAYVSEKCESEHTGTDLNKVQKSRSQESWTYKLLYLAEALHMKSPEIFHLYLLWDQAWTAGEKSDTVGMVKKLQFLDDACRKHLPADKHAEVNKMIASGIEYASVKQTHVTDFLTAENPLLSFAKDYLSLLLDHKKAEAFDLITGLRQKGITIEDIYEYIFKATQRQVGYLWQTNQIEVGQEHYCTAATQVIMSSFYPDIFTSGKKTFKMVACAAGGDIHEMGIRMIADVFEMDGWDTHYLGGNLPDYEIIKHLKINNPDLFAVSVTMPYHLSKVQKLIASMRKDPALSELPVLVGGEPFRLLEGMWKRVGADGFAENGMIAVELANNLIKSKKVRDEAA